MQEKAALKIMQCVSLYKNFLKVCKELESNKELHRIYGDYR